MTNTRGIGPFTVSIVAAVIPSTGAYAMDSWDRTHQVRSDETYGRDRADRGVRLESHGPSEFTPFAWLM